MMTGAGFAYSLAWCGSLFVALVLSIVPLPYHYAWFRPEWLVLWTLFWGLHCPFRASLLVMWGVGLLMDILAGSVWGAHALGLVLVAYFARNFYQRLRALALVQQMLWLALVLMGYLVCVAWINGFDDSYSHRHQSTALVVWPAVITALCWPAWLWAMKPFSHLRQ